MFSGVLLMVGIVMHANAAGAENASEPIPITIRQNIRAVYQIKDDTWEEGIGKGVFYVQKLMAAYQDMQIPNKEVHLHAVFHGDAGYHMLTGDAYDAFKKTDSGNPNTDAVVGLIKAGVSVELCDQTMKAHGWKSEDILPGVKIVIGAYPRIIDLQQQGFAYIRF